MMAAESSSTWPKRSLSNYPPYAPNEKRPAVGHGGYPTISEDATTKEEVQGTNLPSREPGKDCNARSAFSELMAPKPKQKPKTASASASTKADSFSGRNGLGDYIAKPQDFPASRIIFHSPDFVAIRDLYPKATVHCLLLPRSPYKYRLHPFEAFQDPVFLASVRLEATRLAVLVSKELRRLLGHYSTSESVRNAVLDGQVEPERDEGGAVVLPKGRDWSKEVIVGVHARPSMNHLHVHVLSRDMHSDKMKVGKHYNSFTTGFFVPLSDFPLAEDDPRRNQSGWSEQPLACWRCGTNFGNKFKQLKEHLEREYDEWKRG